MIVYGKTQSSTLLQDVQAVLKHPDYPDSLGKAVLINSIHEKQKLSAVGLRTVMAKTKESSVRSSWSKDLISWPQWWSLQKRKKHLTLRTPSPLSNIVVKLSWCFEGCFSAGGPGNQITVNGSMNKWEIDQISQVCRETWPLGTSGHFSITTTQNAQQKQQAKQ